MQEQPDLLRRDLIAADWRQALDPVSAELDRVNAYLQTERAAGRTFLPADDQILRAFHRPLRDVRVLLLGQDPYPTPGHPVGLSFSVDAAVQPLPASLRNIFTELVADLACPAPPNGDLQPWADAGVLLLNTTLTVRAGASNSHRHAGWGAVTAHAVRALVERGGPLVAILWGRDAQTVRPLLDTVPVVESAHPSPLSAHRGFFGSQPFSTTNTLLRAQGSDPVSWLL